MASVFYRALWIVLAACAVAYASYLLLGSVLARAETYAPVLVRDELGPNSHRLTGMVDVPASCDELTVRTEELTNDSFMLVFTTWREPSVPCATGPVPRPFHAVVFAPAVGISFSAALNGAPVDVVVLPTRPIAEIAP